MNPEEMPSFLNDVSEMIDDEVVKEKLAECSIYILVTIRAKSKST